MLSFWNKLPVLASSVVFLPLGFLECKAQSPSAEVAGPPILPANTRVFLQLDETLSKHVAKPGDRVALSVASDVVVNGQILITRWTAVTATFRGLKQDGKGRSEVLFEVDPVETTTGETAGLVRLRTTDKQEDGVGDAIGAGGQTGALAPVVIPVLVVAEVFHRRNVLLEKGSCVQAQLAQDVALDPAKVLALPHEQYGASARARAGLLMTSPCNVPPLHAVREYRGNVQSRPNDPAARIGLIEALDDSGDVDAAFVEVKEAIRVWTDDPYLHYLIGKLLVEKNDPDAAIVELQWALKKENNHLSSANCALGRAFELKGDLEAALHQYRTAFRAHVRDENCRAAYERLKLQLKK